LAFVSELSKRAVTNIRFYLEIRLLFKTLKSVRRMFDAVIRIRLQWSYN
jgi:hypothetical protein